MLRAISHPDPRDPRTASASRAKNFPFPRKDFVRWTRARVTPGCVYITPCQSFDGSLAGAHSRRTACDAIGRRRQKKTHTHTHRAHAQMAGGRPKEGKKVVDRAKNSGPPQARFGHGMARISVRLSPSAGERSRKSHSGGRKCKSSSMADGGNAFRLLLVAPVRIELRC